MNEATIANYLTDTFAGVENTDAFGYAFFFHGPDRMFPFTTLAAADKEYDRVSQLDRFLGEMLFFMFRLFRK